MTSTYSSRVNNYINNDSPVDSYTPMHSLNNEKNTNPQPRLSDNINSVFSENFNEEKEQRIHANAIFINENGLNIHSDSGQFDILNYRWHDYNSNTLFLTENNKFKIGLEEKGFKTFSFDYFSLHNYTSKVHFYDPDGKLISSVDLEYTGTPNGNNFVIKTLNFTAPAGKLIGLVVIDVGNEPAAGDSGFNIDNISWSGVEVTEATPLLLSMEKDSGASQTDLITNDGSAGRRVKGTLSRLLSADEQLELWNGKQWIVATVNTLHWSITDDSAHSSSWQYKLRVTHATRGAGQEVSYDVVLDTTPSSVKALFHSMSADDGSSTTDWQTSDGSAQREVRGSLDRAMSKGDSAQYSIDGGKNWLSLTVGADLSFSFIDTSAHGDSWNYQVRVTDIAGNIAPASQQDVIFLMLPPQITQVFDSVGATHFITNPGFTDDTTPTLHGTSQPNTYVAIYNGNQWLGDCKVNAAGNWSWTSTDAFENGMYDFRAVTFGSGSRSEFSTSWPVTIAAAPQILNAYDDAGPVQGNLSYGESTDDTTPSLLGKAPAGSLVTIYSDNNKIASVTTDNTGHWTWSIADNYPQGLSLGTHTFIARAPIGDGSSSTSNSWVIKIIPPLPPVVALIDGMTQDSGTYTDDFITNDGGAGRTVSGTLSRALVGTEIVEFWNGSQWQAAVSHGTSWSAVDTASHTTNWLYKVRVAEGTGNYGSESEREVTLDRKVATPAITHLWDAVGETGKVFKGGKTDDARPTICGTAEPGVTVEIHYGRASLPWQPSGSAIADANGNWSWIPPRYLPNDIWEVRARAIDIAGNVSSWAPKIVFTVDSDITSKDVFATIDSMSLDTGISASDFVTSDGSAGRTVNGVLNRALAKKETLEFWDGFNWQKATVSGTTWFAVDNNAHSTSWTYKVRVQRADGSYGIETECDVMLEVVKSNPIRTETSSVQSILLWDENTILTDTEKFVHQLIIDGENQHLQLHKLSPMLNVNILDITGTGDNQITLTANDILQMGSSELFIADDTTQLQINGNAGDIVNLKHYFDDNQLMAWHKSEGVIVSGGKSYSVWEYGSANIELLIQSEIDVTM